MVNKLDSNVSLNAQPLSGLVGDTEDVNILGYAAMYTIGKIEAPHDWLVDRATELGIPEYMLPSQPRPSTAYRRAMDRVVDSKKKTTGEIQGHSTRLEIRKDENSRNVRHVSIAVYQDAEEDEETGEWESFTLGYVNYDKDTQGPRFTPRYADDVNDEALLSEFADTWQTFKQEATKEFNYMKEHHNGQDIRNTMQRIMNTYTDTIVPLRDSGAVYFVPASLADTIDAWSTLLDEAGQKYKSGGYEAELRTIPMMDSDEQREWVEERVRKSLDKIVDSVLESAFDDLDEETTADEIVKTIMDDLGGAVDTADEYNALLSAQLDVEEILERQKDLFDNEDKQDIIDKVLSQQTLA